MGVRTRQPLGIVEGAPESDSSMASGDQSSSVARRISRPSRALSIRLKSASMGGGRRSVTVSVFNPLLCLTSRTVCKSSMGHLACRAGNFASICLEAGARTNITHLGTRMVRRQREPGKIMTDIGSSDSSCIPFNAARLPGRES